MSKQRSGNVPHDPTPPAAGLTERLAVVWGFLKTNIGLVVLAQLLALTPFRLVSFVLVLWVAARLLAFDKGLFTRLALSFVLVTTFVTFIAAGVWLLKLPLSSGILLTILNLALLGLIYLGRWRKVPVLPLLRTNAHDCLAAVMAVAATVLILWPVIQLSDGGRLVQVITAGGDNTAHLEMIKGNDLNRGLPYGDGNRIEYRQDFKSYPQGWHFNVAFLKWLTEPQTSYQNQPRNTLWLFYHVAAVWFGLLIFFVARLALMVIQSLRAQRRRDHLALVAVVAVCAAVNLHWLTGLFAAGFQSQIGATVLLLAELFFVMEAFQRKSADRYPLLLLAGAMAVGSTFVWTFVIPITFGILATALVTTVVQAKRWPPVYAWIGMAVLAGLSTIQPLLYKLYPPKLEFPIYLQRGDVQHTSMYTLLFLSVLVVLLLTLHWQNKLIRIVAGSVAFALLVSLILFFYHLNVLGELRYFYFKATYVFIVLVTILLAVVAYEILRLLLAERAAIRQWVHSGVLTVGALTLGVLVCYQVRTPVVDLYAQSTIAGIEAGQAWPLINAVSESPGNGYYTTFIGSCNRGNDIRATQLARALALDDSVLLKQHRFFNPAEHDENELFRDLDRAINASDRVITVISGDQVISDKLLAYLGLNAGKINIVNYDTTPDTEPIEQCPDRVRDLHAFPLQ